MNVLYSTGCPKCKVLKAKLDKAGISYEENDSVEEMQALGMLSAPALSVDGVLYDFSAAAKWADEQGGPGR